MNNIKYIKRIDTTNKVNEYIDEQTIEFVLPKNKQDLSSFKIFFDVEIDPVYEYNDGSYLKRFMPRLTSSIIDTISICKDGEDFQTIKDYNVIFNIINDATKEEDDIDGDRPDTLNYCLIDANNNPKKICDFNNSTNDDVREPLKYRYFITSFLGFLGEHSSSILDCSKHEYKIAITLAPKYITYRGIENTGVKVSFTGGGGDGASATANLTKSISYITLNNQGAGYTSVPTVVFNGGGGNSAAATAVMELDAITVSNGGANYTSVPTITITGGTGGAASAVMSVGAISLTGAGSGYTSIPTVVFTGLNENTADATAKLNVNSIQITNGGTGYTTAPTVVFTGGNPTTAAIATAVLTGDAITSITITNAGSGYNTVPAISFTGGGGTGAAGIAKLKIESLTLNNSGKGYLLPPTISFTGGAPDTDATATSTLKVQSVNITNNGTGYTVPPTIGFTGGAGTGAVAAATLKIDKINITNAGTAYTSTPTITFTGGAGTGGAATASIVCTISSITVNNGGSGYFSTPFVSISGGEPSSHAVATANIDANGTITSITVVDGGKGYSDALSVFATYPVDYHYRLSNVFANIDVLPDNTPASSQITFKHYKTIRGSKNNTKNISLSHTHKGKINYLMSSFVVFGENDTGLQLTSCNTDTTKFGEFFKDCYGDIFSYEDTPMTSKTASSKTAKSLSTENNLDNSLYFKRAGSNVKTSQLFMNGMAITPAMDIPQIYNVAKEFFNNSMNRVKSLASFENEFFVFPMMINQDQEDYSSEIEWICSAGERQDFNAYPILILCADKTIDV